MLIDRLDSMVHLQVCRPFTNVGTHSNTEYTLSTTAPTALTPSERVPGVVEQSYLGALFKGISAGDSGVKGPPEAPLMMCG